MPTPNTPPAIDAYAQKEVLVVEPNIYSPYTRKSKDNNINSESTKLNDPTKRLDKVDDATDRIAYNIKNTSITLEINRDRLLEEITTKIGSFDTNEFFHNGKR